MNIYPVNTKIWFDGERHAYTVQACDDRYLVCTKPYNLYKTVMYTIVDLQGEIRGADSRVFSKGYETQKDCKTALKELQTGALEISYRNQVPLKIKRTEWRRDGW